MTSEDPYAVLERALLELKTTFKAELPTRLAVIEEKLPLLSQTERSLDEKTEIIRLIHSLVGAGATFGLEAVSETARTLETLAKTSLSNETLPNLTDLKIAFNALRASVEPLK